MARELIKWTDRVLLEIASIGISKIKLSSLNNEAIL